MFLTLRQKKKVCLVLLISFCLTLLPAVIGRASSSAPKLIVTSINTSPNTIDLGEAFDATLYIKNVGENSAKNIKVHINKNNTLSPFAPYKMGSTLYVSVPEDRLRKNEEATQRIKLGSNASASPGINNLYVTLEYEDENGQNYQNEQIIGIPLEKPEDKPKFEPKLVISRVQTSPSSVEVGENFTLTLDITNFGTDWAKSIKVSATEVEGQGGLTVFSPVNRSNSIYINSIEDGDSETKSLQFAVSPKAEPKKYNLNIKLEYRSNDGKEYYTSEVVGVAVTKNGMTYKEDINPLLTVTSYKLGKSPVIAGQNFDLTLELSNPTKVPVKNAKITLENAGAETDILATTSTGNTIFVLQVDKFSTVIKTIPLGINKKASSGRHNVAVIIDYRDEYGGTYQEKEFISIPVINPEETKYLKQPKVMIVDCRLATEKIEAGKPFDIELVVKNIGGEVAQNVALTLTNVQGEQGLMVFAPLKSSNAVFVSRLGAHESKVLKQRMFVSGEAMSKVYNIVVKVEYENKDGQPLVHEEVIGIPIIQDQSLQITTFDYPKKVKPGKEIKIYSDFINMGKHPIENLLISFTGNFEVDYPTYFIGKFDVGSSEVFETVATIDKPGTYTGEVTFSYINDYKQETKITKPITIVVEEPKKKTVAVQNKSGGGIWAWIKRVILAIFGLG